MTSHRFNTLLLALFFALISVYAKASSYNFTSANTVVYKELLKLKVGYAEKYFSNSPSNNSDNGIDLYLESVSDAMRLVVTEDASLYESFMQKSSKRLQRLEKFDRNSPYHLFLKAEMKMHIAIVKIKFGNRVDGLTDALSAYSILKDNAEKYPDFLPNKKTLGLCKVLLGAMPKQSKKWVALIGYKGDVEEGMRDLQSVADSNTPFSIEAKFIMAFVRSYVFDEHEKAYKEFDKLAMEYPDSQLAYFAASIAARQNGNAKQALRMLERAPKGTEYCDFVFLDYLKSESCLQVGEYYKSIMYAKRFISNYKGQNYVKDAYHKIFLAYWFLNDSRAWEYLKLSKEKGVYHTVPDLYAKRFADDAELPNKSITQARVYFDGGENAKAMLIINQVDPAKLTRQRDIIEYYYRKGRIQQKQNFLILAAQSYKKAAELCPTEYPYYFGAASALQLGYIYRDFYKDNKTARSYFNKVADYEGHEYESSLNYKAKAALTVLPK
jgi:tetratricopeptide (TPR) repeat protein